LIGEYKEYIDYEFALKNRLASLINLYNTEKDYPFRVRILGFPVTNFINKEELAKRIKELCEILHMPYPELEEIRGDTKRVMKIL
jgi:glutathione peroxidase-family protein